MQMWSSNEKLATYYRKVNKKIVNFISYLGRNQNHQVATLNMKSIANKLRNLYVCSYILVSGNIQNKSLTPTHVRKIKFM